MEEVFCKKVEEKHARIEKSERWRRKIKLQKNREIGQKNWIHRDAEQRMRKEQKALEEERQEIAQRREEYQRELKEWEEGLETVSIIWSNTNTKQPKRA